MAVRRGVVAHGGFLNVSPPLELHHRVVAVRRPTADGGLEPVSMGSIEADIQRRARLQDARTAVIQQLADAFGFEQTHIQSGFPLPRSAAGPAHPECVSHVG